jgi:Domain of unknown function (DUF4347)/Putative Ig domain/FG-GAP-like repeat/Domain of unknown function (DUF4114)
MNNLLLSSSVVNKLDVQTLVVFDSRLEDLTTLSNALLPGVIGHKIPVSANGIEVITELLTTTGARRLAIVAHGEPGVVHLGAEAIDREILNARSGLLQEWGIDSIDLYACEVGKGKTGLEFLRLLSDVTGAVVSGTTVLLGKVEVGSNWSLDVATADWDGSPIFDVDALREYPANLAINVTVASGAAPVEGGTIGTFLINLNEPAPVGGLVVNFAATGGTATTQTDYSFSAGNNITALTANSFTIAAGQTSAVLNVVAVADTVLDPNETVVLSILDGSGYTLTNSFAITADSPLNSFPNQPLSITTGDFNGDGKADLVMGGGYGDNFSVVLGNGDGSFGINTNFNIAFDPQERKNLNFNFSFVTGDFNGDGKTDLVTDNSNGGNVSLLLGNGDGSFGTAANFTIRGNKYVTAITTGDFNGDGKTDLVTGNGYGDNVSVFLGNGSRGLGIATDFAAGSSVISVATGDFNGDGKSDLITTNLLSRNASVLLGNGDGSFGSPTNIAVGSNPTNIFLGDFNGDSKTDLVANNSIDRSLSVLLGNGDGSFGNATNIAVGFETSDISLEDFNGDGNTDLVTYSSGAMNNRVSVLLGNGNGSFRTSTNFSVPSVNGDSFVAGEFNSDDRIDLALFNNNINDGAPGFSLLLNEFASAALAIVDTPPQRNNRAPIVATSLTNQTVNQGQLISFAVPTNAFSDPDEGDVLTYSVVLANGNPLPTWLTFNPETRTFSGTATAADVGTLDLQVKATDLGGLIASSNFGLTIAPVATPTNKSYKFNLTSNKSDRINEIGLFLTDSTGKVNGVAPTDTVNFQQAALSNATVIFSSIFNSPNGFNQNLLTRTLNSLQLPADTNIGFYAIQQATTDEVIAGASAKVIFGTSNNPSLKANDITGTPLTLNFRSPDSNSALNLDLTIQQASDTVPVGALTQGIQPGYSIDLSAIATPTAKATFTIYREAAYNNTIGFYKANADGSIVDESGKTLKPSDGAAYVAAAVKNAIRVGTNLSVANQSTASFDVVLDKSIYMPILVSDGTLAEANSGAKLNQTYTSFLGANSDRTDHVRLLGDNTFGFEDLANGGDRDFNDMIVKVTIAPITAAG